MKEMPSRCRWSVETLPRAASSRGDSHFPQSAAAGCPSRVHPLRTTGHLPTSTPRLSRLLPSRLVDPVAAALVGEHDGDKIGNLTGDTEARGRRGTVAAWMWSRGGVEASGREELDLGPRRLPSLHLFLVLLVIYMVFLVLLVIYMVFLVGRCFVVLIRHSAVPRSSMKKPRRKADQQCPRSTRTSQPDVYMIQVSFSTPRFGP